MQMCYQKMQVDVYKRQILYIPRKVLEFVDFCGSFAQGFKAMTSAIMILCLAWTLSGVCGAEYLNCLLYTSTGRKSLFVVKFRRDFGKFG